MARKEYSNGQHLGQLLALSRGKRIGVHDKDINVLLLAHLLEYHHLNKIALKRWED